MICLAILTELLPCRVYIVLQLQPHLHLLCSIWWMSLCVDNPVGETSTVQRHIRHKQNSRGRINVPHPCESSDNSKW